LRKRNTPNKTNTKKQRHTPPTQTSFAGVLEAPKKLNTTTVWEGTSPNKNQNRHLQKLGRDWEKKKKKKKTKGHQGDQAPKKNKKKKKKKPIKKGFHV